MPTVLDLLNAPEFADDRLQDSINIPPYETGRPAQLGIFTDDPIATTYVRMLVRGGEITIIPAVERGGPSNKNMGEDIGETLVSIPHFPLDDAITPADLQNLHAFGEARIFQTLAGVVNRKLTTMRAKHDATHHHLDWGALRGQVVDAKGRLLVDLYDTFDITKKVIDFDLDNASADLAAKNRELKSHMRKNLRGAASRGVLLLAGGNFFDRYVSHASVKEALKAYKDANANPQREDITDRFTYAGVTLERVDEDFSYRKPDGTFEVQEAVDPDAAIALPLGTPFFKRYVAPPDTINDANRAPDPAQKIFVSTDDLPHGKGRDIHTESNVLPVCVRPELLVECTRT